MRHSSVLHDLRHYPQQRLLVGCEERLQSLFCCKDLKAIYTRHQHYAECLHVGSSSQHNHPCHTSHSFVIIAFEVWFITTPVYNCPTMCFSSPSHLSTLWVLNIWVAFKAWDRSKVKIWSCISTLPRAFTHYSWKHLDKNFEANRGSSLPIIKKENRWFW